MNWTDYNIITIICIRNRLNEIKSQNTVEYIFFQIQFHTAVNRELSRLVFNKQKIKMDIPVANSTLMLLYILSLGQWSVWFGEVMDQVNSLKYSTSSS